ncbi:MAG: glycoside hydrolase family 43 protein [Rhodanobacter sp.]
MKKETQWLLLGLLLSGLFTCLSANAGDHKARAEHSSLEHAHYSGNPVFNGWYADPDAIRTQGEYWIYATTSAAYEKQLYFDAFSSHDLVNWTKHAQVLQVGGVSWVKKALWAPSVIAKDGKYYLFFSANDIHTDQELGGIGVAVADQPAGPFKDLIGKPLIGKFENHAQPIDPSVFKDKDGSYYLLYGGWKHLNVARLGDDFKSIVPLRDGSRFKLITPAHYVEGPVMFLRHGTYYLMWSEGDWVGSAYSVAYAMADSPLGPFKRIGNVLKANPKVAKGTGGNTVIHVPNSDTWYIVYHRRPLGDKDPNHRVVSIDRMVFDKRGHIEPVKITFKGVAANPLPQAR